MLSIMKIRKKLRLILPLFLILFLLYSFGFLPLPAKNCPSVIAHRGASAHIPENTLPAIARAMQCGADSIELDIRQSRDGIPVVFHDADTRRLTENTGKVSELSCQRLMKLTVKEGAFPASVCSLEQALCLCDGTPGLCIHLDMKVSGIEEKVVSLMQKHDSGLSYEISSSDSALLQRIKQLSPQTETFLILADLEDITTYITAAPSHIDGISVKSFWLSRPLISLAKKRGHSVYGWTINDLSGFLRMQRLGVDAVITDSPGEIRFYQQ